MPTDDSRGPISTAWNISKIIEMNIMTGCRLFFRDDEWRGRAAFLLCDSIAQIQAISRTRR